MGLEESTSSNDIAFNERSLTQIFNPIRNTGVLTHKYFKSSRINWQLGLFQNTDLSVAGVPGVLPLSFRLFGCRRTQLRLSMSTTTQTIASSSTPPM